MGKTTKHQKTILLLDDEEIERSTARQILQGEGYTVLEADSYNSAINVFESNRAAIDLLLADISLPDGNGCELAIAARNQKEDLRVLFVSGHVGAEVCRFYGLDVTDLHFLRKPFEAQQLLQCVRRVLQAAEPFPRLLPKTQKALGDS
jgi:DNA-binding response OmpR family regulator